MAQSRLLKAIADPIRIRIIALLIREENNICVEEMVSLFDREQPTISHHLRILRDAGLVGFRRHGLFIYYHVHIGALIQAWKIIENLVNLS